MELPLKDGSLYAVDDSLYNDLCQCYPSLDVSEHLQEMRIWLVCNDQKRKTRRGIKRFINSWLSRAKGNNSEGYQQPHKKLSIAEQQAESRRQGEQIRANLSTGGNDHQVLGENGSDIRGQVVLAEWPDDGGRHIYRELPALVRRDG